MSVVAARGFGAAGVASGIKPDGLDLAAVVSDRPAVAAGVFTTNQAAAAPVLLCRSHLAASPTVRAVVVNAGCANAATGAEGAKNAKRMAEEAAAMLGVDESEVLICSTGTIGRQLPMDVVSRGIRAACEALDTDESSGSAAARAFMTTDSVHKESVVRDAGWVIGGMAKGAGMLRPDMATMLAVITTDAVVDSAALASSLADAVDGTFNSLNVDGCESTNDSVVVLANGASGVRPTPDAFTGALGALCHDLAIQMARDAEGSTRMVTIEMRGAVDDRSARVLGRLVADSALVRSSFYGGDVNWGRIVGALGTSDIPIDFDEVTIAYHGVTVFEAGVGAIYDEVSLLERCRTGDLRLTVTLGDGDGAADVVTTDLTPEYVIFNGERS